MLQGQSAAMEHGTGDFYANAHAVSRNAVSKYHKEGRWIIFVFFKLPDSIDSFCFHRAGPIILVTDMSRCLNINLRPGLDVELP